MHFAHRGLPIRDGRQSITTELVRRLTADPPPKDVDIYDTHQPRLVLRARASGRHSYRVVLARRRRKEETLSQYILTTYQPWLVAHRRAATETVLRLMAISEQLGTLRLSEVPAWHIERFRTAKLNAGRTPATINRDVGAFRAMLNRAVEWGHLSAHPLRSVRALREDKIGRLRYLLHEEQARLRSALQVGTIGLTLLTIYYGRWKDEPEYSKPNPQPELSQRGWSYACATRFPSESGGRAGSPWRGEDPVAPPVELHEGCFQP